VGGKVEKVRYHREVKVCQGCFLKEVHRYCLD
jgi:hypothetical protein